MQDFNSGKLKFSETLVPSSFLLTNNKTASLNVTNLLNFGWYKMVQVVIVEW